RGVELRDRARPAAAMADAFPESLASDTERRDDTDAGDHNPRAALVRHVAPILIQTTRMTKFIAWLGGGMFVASLALTTWWYGVTLGRAVPRSGLASLSFDAALI